ncbi:HCL546Wp [Eremothecium sinecaudum]|uniref:HCL546Wp n=1 Tax=Eremothecium sinecaudum TaxID=45286 RepID=A0A120K1P3_9SACH|nr:HCL546Wp [Eremothecium sinecaudum]AMD19605.1 HCL546Wp [Eremothecium sinecaudum]
MAKTPKNIAKYAQMIKFVGGRHPSLSHGAAGPHPCTVDGLMPGSKDCIAPGDFLSKLLPFKVVPYSKPVTKPGTSQKAFTNRPLKEGEVNSVFELPSKYRMKPMEEIEIECINNGGIY